MMQFDFNDGHIDPRILDGLGISSEGGRREKLLSQLIERLGRIATSIGHDPRLDAGDIAQETCLRLLHITAAGSFDPGKCRSVKAYVKGVMRKVIAEQFRPLSRRDRRETTYIELKSVKPDDPAELAEREELLRLVREAYLRLAVPQRATVRRIYPFLDPSSDETVARRIRRSNERLAIEQLKKMLKPQINTVHPGEQKPPDPPK